MKDFRFLVKVNSDKPEESLNRLSELVGYAISVPLDFVAEQEFITAVPIDIALSMPDRAYALYHRPKLSFVVTGVPASRISNLCEFGYRVFPSKPLGDDDGGDSGVLADQDNRDTPEESECKEGEPDPNPEQESPKELEPEHEEPKPRYWVNGTSVSKEEFEKAVEDFKDKWKENGGSLEKLARGFAAAGLHVFDIL